ncbi:anti-sigma factor domain-containing protein [Jannaschia sp. 2305UL9-9]|uniref:anti-sigma factor n=1 Tax=Jannaschia sp. 2305UL9-9 TaxID=3121638 RepID=UPI00352888BA
MSTDFPEPVDDDLRAAEHALHLLEGDARAAADRDMLDDPSFRAAVHRWERDLATFADDLAPMTPPAHLRRALHDRLFPEAAKQPFWRRTRLWQGLTLAAAVAIVGLILLPSLTQVPATGPVYSAEIVAAEGDFRVVAVVDKVADVIVLTRTEGAAPPGRILQVWAHGPDAPATSVGLWPEGDVVRLPLTPTIAAVEGVLTIGVSEEPPGGSPTGSPSGRVFGTVDIPGVAAPE